MAVVPTTLGPRDGPIGRGRKLLRTVGYVLVTYPYAIATIPLAVWLLTRLGLAAWAAWVEIPEDQDHTWYGLAACIAAVISFALLVAGYLLLAVVQGWRGNGRNKQPR